jgi:hypothetical protein
MELVLLLRERYQLLNEGSQRLGLLDRGGNPTMVDEGAGQIAHEGHAMGRVSAEFSAVFKVSHGSIFPLLNVH